MDEHIGDEPVAPVAPRIAVRAAEYDLPAGIVAALDIHLRANAAGDRLLDTLSELQRIRAEAGWPPLASPIGQILGSQAMLNVLSARRYGTLHEKFRHLVEGAYGATPAPIEAVAAGAGRRAPGRPRPLLEDDAPSTEDVLEAADGLAASEEDLVLLALFGEQAETLLKTIRQRHTGEASLLDDDADAERAGRIREIVKIVQESGVGEIEIEDEGMRVSVRRADEPAVVRRRRSRRMRRRRPPGGEATAWCASRRRWSASSIARRTRARRRSWRSATPSASGRRCACSRR